MTPMGRYGVSIGGDEMVLELVVMVAELCEYTKNHELYSFKGMFYGM